MATCKSRLSQSFISLSLLAVAACGDRPAAPLYGVQGSVTGLAGGTTLTLSNNQSDTVTVSADGTFKFNDPIPDGTVYAVSVSEQPTGQTCTVQNASGVVNGVQVTGIQVVCTLSKQPVSGNAVGVTGSVELQNGGDLVTITADGAFVFPTLLLPGSSYSVRVSGTPTGQTCVVTGGSGTVGQSPVNTVNVTCTPLRYAVGGTVSGLAGTLFLKSSSGEIIQVTASPFSFTTPISNGMAYSVTVAAQPLGQTCTVASPSSGTIAGAAVSVSVSCSDSMFQVGGTLSGLDGTVVLELAAGGGNVTVSQNGPFVVGQLLPGSNYSLSVAQQPNNQACQVTADANGVIGYRNVASVLVTCGPFLTFVNSQGADVEFGQTDFNSTDRGSTVTANAIGGTGGPLNSAAIPYNGGMLIPDFGFSRLLVLDSVPTQNSASADFVVDQATDTNSVLYPANANVMSGPTSVVSEGNITVVADTDYARVLIYTRPITGPTGFVNADVVLGQNGNFTTGAGSCGANGFMDDDINNGFITLALSHGILVVADAGNSRVLIWNTVPTQPGAPPPPDVVLGQPNFTTCNTNPAVNAATVSYPVGVWTDGTRLVVADNSFNRLLIWSKIPTANNVVADIVVGQSDFVSSGTNTSATTLSGPEGVTSNGTQLFVADTDNNRVLIWNTFPTSNGAAADVVLGQFPATPGGDPFSQSATPPASQYTFEGPAGITVTGTQLWVTDYTPRVMLFNAQ